MVCIAGVAFIDSILSFNAAYRADMGILSYASLLPASHRRCFAARIVASLFSICVIASKR